MPAALLLKSMKPLLIYMIKIIIYAASLDLHDLHIHVNVDPGRS